MGKQLESDELLVIGIGEEFPFMDRRALSRRQSGTYNNIFAQEINLDEIGQLSVVMRYVKHAEYFISLTDGISIFVE
jgi:hypothetical protein